MTRQELEDLRIGAPSRAVYDQVKARWDGMAKPLDGMGRFEELTARMGAVFGTPEFQIGKKSVLVLCADNGIVAEGISQSGQEVTAAVARSMGRGESSVCRLAKRAGADVIPVDLGIHSSEAIPGVLDRKILQGTRDFLKEPAMTEGETLAAVRAGMELALDCKERGYQLLAVGEMGIGNTTTTSAVAAALTGCPVEAITGRGAGLDDAGLRRKRQVISQALEQYGLGPEDPLRVLSTVGGLDLAGMVGIYLGGALARIPVVLDGVISVAAALAAEKLKPGVREYLIPSHKSKEPAAGRLLQQLGLDPVLDAGMALGEGTGAVMMFALLDLAMALYQNQTLFADMELEPYVRFETGEKED